MQNSYQKTYISENLRTWWKVSIRVDGVRRPLEASYTGPFEVRQHTPSEILPYQVEWRYPPPITVDKLKLYVEANNKHAKQTDNTSNREKLIQSTEALENKTDPSYPKVIKITSGRLFSWTKDNDYIYY